MIAMELGQNGSYTNSLHEICVLDVNISQHFIVLLGFFQKKYVRFSAPYKESGETDAK
jgi:hypothetical protein